VSVAACGPSGRKDGTCSGDDCTSGACDPGETRDCYTGKDGTIDVGPCKGGEQTCTAAGQWGSCVGEVVPVAENCGDGIDNNCNGAMDENEDRDGDGFNTCAGDCCDSTECSNPELVNPNAFDAAGNNVDDDCNGTVDDAIALCDQNLMSSSSDPFDYAKAMDICQTTTMTDNKWGVISATLTLTDGTGTPDPVSRAIRPMFGTKTAPRGGVNMAVFSTGHAAGVNDSNPSYEPWVLGYDSGLNAPFPADFLAANGGNLPNAPGCPPPDDFFETGANDPVMLTLTIRVPSNAHSFSLKSNFYSSEFPEYTCSPYNDFFVILLDSMYTGNPANPMDKNLAFYAGAGNTNYPVGVNLAKGDTGLFTQCVNGDTGCSGTAGTISTCVSTDDLAGTGFDTPASGDCDSNSLMGGATGWLTTSGNVMPGEIITLRIAIWDTSDHSWDSLALVDGFQWSVDSTQPGTVILRSDNPQLPPQTPPTSSAQ
jgi:hypothetical protein